MQVLKFDELTVDGVDVMNAVAEFAIAADRFLGNWQVVSDTVIRPAVVKGAVHGFWLAVDGADRLVDLSQAVISAGRQHRIKYGAQYAAVLLTIVGLLVMLVRAQLGREGAYAELCVYTVSAREGVQSWVWAQLMAGYEVWLGAVSREVTELLEYAPEWVRMAVLR
jgi:hypothetical protein